MNEAPEEQVEEQLHRAISNNKPKPILVVRRSESDIVGRPIEYYQEQTNNQYHIIIEQEDRDGTGFEVLNGHYDNLYHTKVPELTHIDTSSFPSVSYPLDDLNPSTLTPEELQELKGLLCKQEYTPLTNEEKARYDDLVDVARKWNKDFIEKNVRYEMCRTEWKNASSYSKTFTVSDTLTKDEKKQYESLVAFAEEGELGDMNIKYGWAVLWDLQYKLYTSV